MSGAGARSITIYDGIFAAARRTPAKIAIRENDRELSYRRLAERIVRIAHAARALSTGGRAAIIMQNRLEYLEIVCGLSAAGIETCKLAPVASPAEIRFVCEDGGVDLIFTDPALEGAIREAVPEVRAVVAVGPAYEDLLGSASGTDALAAIDWERVFSIPYTSGSTGRPKGVMLSHRARVLSCFAMAAEHGCYGPSDRAVATTPMFHGSGFLMTLAPVFFGGFVELLSNFDVERLMATIARVGATGTFMIPSHFSALFAMGDRRFDRDIGSLKSIIVGTAPLSQPMKERIIDFVGEGKLFERYGSTEAAIVPSLRPEDQLRKQRSVGLPICATQVKLLDAEGREVAPGAVGELYSTSPYMFSGYLNLPDAAARASRGAWFTAGDLAWADDEGYLHLVGRKNDMIISGGENVYPREIEDVLLMHPAILEACVVGVDHDYWGEEVVACIVTREGMTVTDDALKGLLRTHVARFKVPKRFIVLKELPRSRTGKVDRTAVGKLAAAS